MNIQNHLNKIPSVNAVLEALQKSFPKIPQIYLKRITLSEINSIHNYPKLYNLEKQDKERFVESFIDNLTNKIETLRRGSLKKVINATGVVLHTGLGRAPIAEEMAESIKEISRYTNLEIDLKSGKRGERNNHLSFLLQMLTGAEDGFAVNNNAAAVMLMLNSVAKRKEVLISRGEMIEIGGSFRLPEVMKLSGVKLREIGATNKTHLKDYEEALNQKTGAILICHTSNYEVKGFTAKPSIEKIVKLAQKKNIPLIYDMGSGSLVEEHRFGYTKQEPLVSELVAAGADLISFSGDKLLGGPQAGFIVGKRQWVEKCTKNHLLRALRLDKTILKLLQVTLLYYLNGKESYSHIDTLNALLLDQKELRNLTQNFINNLNPSIKKQLILVESVGKVGSGAFPLLELPSIAIRIKSDKKYSVAKLSRKFREYKIPIFGRIEDEHLLFDLRTVSDDELTILKSALEGNLYKLN